jgi:hypothetical protein
MRPFRAIGFLLLVLACSVATPAGPLWAAAPAVAGSNEGWSPVGAGMDGSVNDVVVYRGELVAVGGFRHASGVAADRIARWNGAAWEAFPGGGADGGLFDAIVYADRLIVAGHFDSIGGVAADGLAQWDGAHWSALPGNLFIAVDDMVVHAGQLVIAGIWLVEGPMEHVARWNGSSWSALGGGLDDSIDALGVHDGQLYAAADLPWPDMDPAIWRFDGTAWSVFEDQLDDTVYAFGSFDGRLVAAGRFGSIGGVAANNIARWNGSGWSPLGSGLGNGLGNQRVEALGSYNGQLWAGGYFEAAGGAPVGHVARWNGTAWSSPGSGADYTVSAFVPFAGALVTAGSFAQMDGQPVNYIAAWHEDPVFGDGFESP